MTGAKISNRCRNGVPRPCFITRSKPSINSWIGSTTAGSPTARTGVAVATKSAEVAATKRPRRLYDICIEVVLYATSPNDPPRMLGRGLTSSRYKGALLWRQWFRVRIGSHFCEKKMGVVNLTSFGYGKITVPLAGELT